MRPVSPHFLHQSIADPQGFGAERERVEQERAEQERAEQEFLFRRLKPVDTGYRRNLCCMDGTRQSLLDQVMDWVANQSEQQNDLQRNAYCIYGSPGIR